MIQSVSQGFRLSAAQLVSHTARQVIRPSARQPLSLLDPEMHHIDLQHDTPCALCCLLLSFAKLNTDVKKIHNFTYNVNKIKLIHQNPEKGKTRVMCNVNVVTVLQSLKWEIFTKFG